MKEPQRKMDTVPLKLLQKLSLHRFYKANKKALILIASPNIILISLCTTTF